MTIWRCAEAAGGIPGQMSARLFEKVWYSMASSRPFYYAQCDSFSRFNHIVGTVVAKLEAMTFARTKIVQMNDTL